MRLYVAIFGILITPLTEPTHFTCASKPDGQDTENAKPVTIEVIDIDTNRPVTEFTFSYWIRTPNAKKDDEQEKWKTHKSATGMLELRAPISCELTIGIKAPEYESGYGKTYHSFDLTTEDKDRKLVVKMQRGITVKGTVLDAKTKLPVKGAKVMPVIFRPPLFTPDRERAVRTDDKGTFTILGVGSDGIHIEHVDYLNAKVRVSDSFQTPPPKEIVGKQVLLESGETFLGRVSTPGGQPISGVAISDGAGKRVLTDKDGNFLLRSPEKWQNRGKSYYLEFKKAGFIPKTLTPVKSTPNGMTVVLQPLYELQGRVLGANQRPATTFVVSAGPGRNPPSFRCTKSTVSSGKDGFVLRLEAVGEHWIGVRADGYAVWEGWANVTRQNEPLTIVLKPGVHVTGKLKLPDGDLGPVEVTLTPQRPKSTESLFGASSAARECATLKTQVISDGVFRFEHVRPDNYVLTTAGKRITAVSRALRVSEADTDAGTIPALGTGRVIGQIFHPPGRGKGAWAFKGGSIESQDDTSDGDSRIGFKSDEHGRFEAENVAAGENVVSVSFPRTADVYGSHDRIVRVVPGQTTEVQFFNPTKKQDLVFDFVIGDGSKEQFNTGTGVSSKFAVGNITDRKPMFHIRLTPTFNTPACYPAPDWHEISGTDRPQITLPDVSAGRYRVQIGDWLGSSGVHGSLYETVVDISAEQRFVRIPLGAGSLTGRVQWAKENRHRIHVLARLQDKAIFRTTYSEFDGYFCLRYLPEGRWTLCAHDEDAGYCRIGEFAVKNETKDVGLHKLVAGGTITSKVDLGNEPRLPDAVVAVDAQGFQIAASDFDKKGSKDFAIPSLWPGRWTLKLMSGEAVLGTAQVELKDKAHCILRAQEPRKLPK